MDALTTEQPEDFTVDGEMVALHRGRERRAHWVRPELVAQIGFTEWAPDGMLRHPRYLGLRDDKPAREVVREQPTGRTG